MHVCVFVYMCVCVGGEGGGMYDQCSLGSLAIRGFHWSQDKCLPGESYTVPSTGETGSLATW